VNAKFQLTMSVCWISEETKKTTVYVMFWGKS